MKSPVFENTQKKLDKQKWITSQQYGKDLSGNMCYCLKCEYANCIHTCRATQKEREVGTLCAKAYNRLKRSK